MDINGETYIDGKRLMPDACNYKELNTLDAAIDFLHVTCKDGDFEYPLIVSKQHTRTLKYIVHWISIKT